MVAFICDACGHTVKKVQVEKHYTSQCRSCSVLSCIDCGVDFPGDTYIQHNTCMTEAQKYQGHLYQAKDKENKGEVKQKAWLEQVHDASANMTNPRLKGLFQKLSAYSNIPRKKKKFENFCKNSVNVYDSKTLDELWEVFNAGNKKPEAPPVVVKKKVVAEVDSDSDSDSDTDTEKTVKKVSTDTKTNTETIVDSENTSDENDASFIEVKKKKKTKKVKVDLLPKQDDDTLGKCEAVLSADSLPAVSADSLPAVSAPAPCDEATPVDNDNSCETLSKKKKKKYKQKAVEEQAVEEQAAEEQAVEEQVDIVAVSETDSQSDKKKSKKKNKKNKSNDNVVSVVESSENGDDEDKTKKKKKGKKRKNVEAEEEQSAPLEKKKRVKSGAEEEISPNENGENEEDEDSVVPQGKFHWHKIIKTILKDSDNHEIALKKLKKKVLAAYQEHGVDHRAPNLDASRALFDKKLKTYPKVTIVRETVKLIK